MTLYETVKRLPAVGCARLVTGAAITGRPAAAGDSLVPVAVGAAVSGRGGDQSEQADRRERSPSGSCLSPFLGNVRLYVPETVPGP